MRTDDRGLLVAQLETALAEASGGSGMAMEVAVLAGLLCRHGDRPAVLKDAETWRETGGAEQVQAILSIRPAGEMAERIEVAAEAPDVVERTDALLDVDECCAGAWFCGAGSLLSEEVDLIARLIGAFPDAWRDQVSLATAVLTKAPPAQDDPAWRLWPVVEATRWAPAQAEAHQVPACLEARRTLGLRIPLSLVHLGAAGPALRAADSLPPAAAFQPLLEGTGWELALTQDREDQPVLLLTGRDLQGATLFCQGREVSQTEREGRLLFPAAPGSYRLLIGGEDLRFEISE